MIVLLVVKHGRKPMITDLQERQQMCIDLEYLMTQDMSIREEIIDEYVYLLSDKRFEEMQQYIHKELTADF